MRKGPTTCIQREEPAYIKFFISMSLNGRFNKSLEFITLTSKSECLSHRCFYI